MTRNEFAATPRGLVERFYTDIWNRADEALAHLLLHPDVHFTASLGPDRAGPAGFCDYMRAIHRALGNYTCTIEDLIESGARVVARVRFTGVHQDIFFGVPPTGRVITWTGAAFFTIRAHQIAEIHVLGDIDAVKRQLGAPNSASFSA